MTKPVENPAVVKEVVGNPFDIQKKTKGAVMLLSNNTVQLKNNYVLENFMHDAKERERLIEQFLATPRAALEAAVGPDGKAVTGKDAPIMLHLYEAGSWDPRKMGSMMIMDRDSLIVIGTHYHPSSKVQFAERSFEKALVDYCQLAVLEGRRKDPVIIPMPGMDCVNVRIDDGKGGYVINPEHHQRVRSIIENTMFSDADVTLVIPA